MHSVVVVQCEGQGPEISLDAADVSDGGDCRHSDEGNGDRNGDSQCNFDKDFFPTLPSILGSLVIWPFLGSLAPRGHFLSLKSGPSECQLFVVYCLGCFFS